MAAPRTATVRNALLALLSEGPKYGLQLREEFEAVTGYLWPLNSGQVYTTLDRLEHAGLIEREDSENRGRQRKYRVTARGTSELDGWMSTLGNLALPTREESVLKVLIALRRSTDEAIDVIRLHRGFLLEAQQRWTRLQGETGTGLHLGLVIAAVLGQLQWRVIWLDAAEGRLEGFGVSRRGANGDDRNRSSPRTQR